MNKKRFISWLLSASMLMPLGMFNTALAADHQEGAHDFGDPFAPYVDTKLVLKSQIKEPETILHTSKKVLGSDAVTADIIESSAQFYTRDNGNSGLNDGEYKTINNITEKSEYGNIKNKMFAYMYEPAAEGTYPAILFLHGGGGTADTLKERAKDFAAKGYVTMAIDIPALTGSVGTVTVNGVEETRSDGQYIGNDNYRFNITEKDGGAKNSNLVDAEVGVIQAFNYLASNSKTDTDKMGIMGSSWGGYSTTFVTGILGDKVKAAYSQYGSGFYGPTSDGTKYESFWTDNGYFPKDEFAIEEWYSYLDPSAYLENITANYYMDAAAKDTFFRPKSVEATLNKAANMGNAASANHVWSYNSSHESISGSDSVYTFMDYYLKGQGTAPSKTEITKTVLQQDGTNKVHIKVNSDADPFSVKLVYSKNNAAYTAREWKTMDTVKENDEYTAVIPADVVADGVEYYALTRDSDKAMYSSSMMKTGFTQKVSVDGTPSFTLNNQNVYFLGKGEFAAKVPVVNNDDAEASDVRVLLALYENGSLKEVNSSDTTQLTAGERKEISVSVGIDAEDVSNYTAKIFVWDSIEGMRPYSRTYNLADTDTAPTAPENLEVVRSTINGIELAWDEAEDNIAVEGYNVYRRTDGTYEKIASLSGNALSYTDTMIEVNESYQYAVSAFDASGNESEKAEVRAESVEGAKVVFDAFDDGSSNTVTGEKMQAVLHTREGSPVSIEEDHKPLQDETTLNCLKVENTVGGTYIQLKVDDNYINSELDSRVAVMVTFDEVGFDNIRMQYNAADGTNNKGVVVRKKLNEQRWMTHTYIIEDAAFANALGGYDLRLNFDNDTNYIRMIQIVNLSDDFSAISAGVDSIKLAWKTVENAQAYSIYRDGEFVEMVDAPARSYEDSGLTIDTEYEYRLIAHIGGTEPTISEITASTLKKVAAEVDFANGTESNMRATATGFEEEVIDGIKAFTTESNANTLKLAVDNTAVTGKGHRLVIFKYNDCGNKLRMRVSMINPAIDRAHYFSTTGTGKWETASVLIPDASFNNNAEDIQLKSADNLKYAIADVKLSDCPSYEVGGYYLNGIVSGVTVADDMLNTTMASLSTANEKMSVEVAEVDGEKAIKLNSTDVNNGNKRAEIRLVPDYRFLGQAYGNAKLPSEKDYTEENAAQVRPVTVKVTYYANNTNGALYVKGAKKKAEDGSIYWPDNDASLSLIGSGEWKTVKINIDDYYVKGTSESTFSPIQFIASAVPENEDIIIGKIEVTYRDYSTKLGEYSFADPDNAEALTMTADEGITVDDGAATITGTDKSLHFAVDKNVVSGQKDRLVTITYHDGGMADIPVRVSMINTAIDGAHYFYTAGTNRWETTTVLIPDAQFGGMDSDITIRLTRSDGTIKISKVELFDGSEHEDRTEDMGETGATGIRSGLTAYNGMFNSSLATWKTNDVTSFVPEKLDDGTYGIRIKSSQENERAEFSIVPDYRYLGLTQKSESVSDGVKTPIKVRVTYKKNAGTMFIKCTELNEEENGLVMTSEDNQQRIVLGSGDGEWITAEVDLDNFYMVGGSTKRDSYIQFVTNAATGGTLIKSIEIINKIVE